MVSTVGSLSEIQSFMDKYHPTDVAVIGERGYGEEDIVPKARFYTMEEVDITKGPLLRKHEAIICSDVFEHIYDPVRAAENIGKSLKKGGLLYFSAPSIWPYHEFPIDTYRYTDTAILWLFRALDVKRCWRGWEGDECHRVCLIAIK